MINLQILKKEEKNLKGYVKNMFENSIKFFFTNYWRSIDKKIFLCFFILFFLGLFFSFSSTSSLAGERLNKDYYFFFFKTSFFYFFSYIYYDYYFNIKTEILIKLITPLFIISFIFLALVPVIGVEVKGAKRWIDLYFFRLQPIEILKPFFILMTVKILALDKFKNSRIRYILSFMLLCSVIILLIDQPDLGQSILLILEAWIATVFVSGVSLLYIFIFFQFF